MMMILAKRQLFKGFFFFNHTLSQAALRPHIIVNQTGSEYNFWVKCLYTCHNFFQSLSHGSSKKNHGLE